MGAGSQGAQPCVGVSRAYRYKRTIVPTASSATRGSWTLVFKVAVSLGLLVYLAWRVDFPGLARFLAGVDPTWLVAAVTLYLAGQALSAVKWRLLAVALGFEGTRARFVAYYFIGMFFNAFGFGTVGGDVVRTLYLAGGGGRRALAANTVLADRVSGLLVLLAIALVALGVFHHYELPASIYWTVVVIASGLLGGWRLLPCLLPLALPAENRLRRLVDRDLAPYWNDGKLLAHVALLSLAFHVSQIGVLMILIVALRLDVPWSYCFIFGPLVNIMAAIPVSLNGLGVREGGYVFFLSHIGIAREAAVGFALTWFAVVMLAGLAGGVVYLLHGERREG
jgi:uncharacterized membrane protein YbhN (UPF0104 family)